MMKITVISKSIGVALAVILSALLSYLAFLLILNGVESILSFSREWVEIMESYIASHYITPATCFILLFILSFNAAYHWFDRDKIKKHNAYALIFRIAIYFIICLFLYPFFELVFKTPSDYVNGIYTFFLSLFFFIVLCGGRITVSLVVEFLNDFKKSEI